VRVVPTIWLVITGRYAVPVLVEVFVDLSVAIIILVIASFHDRPEIVFA
jgi:hypothetical protein